MPTYDYRCADCGHRFEIFERIHESGAKACPKCGRKRAQRQIGAGAGLIFKGSGFYVTDSKGSSGDSPSSGKPSDKKKTTRKKADTTEAKPEKTEKK